METPSEGLRIERAILAPHPHTRARRRRGDRMVSVKKRIKRLTKRQDNLENAFRKIKSRRVRKTTKRGRKN
jgi:hypothetical protein